MDPHILVISYTRQQDPRDEEKKGKKKQSKPTPPQTFVAKDDVFSPTNFGFKFYCYFFKVVSYVYVGGIRVSMV
jgi:hypothetical protein